MVGPHRIVVAAHDENLDWLGTFPGWWHDVVRKGVHVCNVGREASSYLSWMIFAGDVLSGRETVAFVQGNPFDHTAELDLRSVDRFTPFSDERLLVDRNGRPHHGEDIPVGAAYERFVGREFPVGGIEFTPAAQFLVPASLILDRDWKDLYHYSLEEPAAPWVLERIWEPIFNGGTA